MGRAGFRAGFSGAGDACVNGRLGLYAESNAVFVCFGFGLFWSDDMIKTPMDSAKFLSEVKERRCASDWHERYFTRQARKYHRIDYWLKSIIGLLGLLGAALVGNNSFSALGGVISGGCAFVLGVILPNFGWDKIVHGFEQEQEAWTRIRQGYENILRLAEMSDRGEILLQDFQQVREMEKTAELDEKHLPKNQKLLDEIEKEVRKYYGA